jgi:hypothetical protein
MTNRSKALSSQVLNAWALLGNCTSENLPEWILTSTLKALHDGKHLRATELPSAHFLHSLSKPQIIRRLQDSCFVREIAAKALFFLSYQERLAARNPAWKERASLAARRWLIYCCACRKELLPRDISIQLERCDTLFKAVLRADGEQFAPVRHHVTRETIDRSKRDMISLLRQLPILFTKSAADVDWDDAESFAKDKTRHSFLSADERESNLARRFAAATSSYFLDYSSFPKAIAIVQRISKDFREATTTNCSSLRAIKLCLGLSIYFGIPWKDLLFARFARDPRSSQHGDSPFEIAGEVLTIRPGHPFYPLGAMAFDETDLRMPLLPELSGLANSLRFVASQGQTLHDLIGPDPSDRIRAYLKRAINPSKKLGQDLASGLHLPFVTLAIDRLGESPTVVSLLRCNPLPMLRGECAYLIESKQLIVATLIRIQNAIRSYAELDQVVFTNSYMSDVERAGSLQLYPADFYHRLTQKVQKADDWNRTVACIELLMRGFGKRPVNDHQNPATILTHFPIRHLLFADKLVSGVIRRRFVPIEECLSDLAQAAESAFGSSRSLPYLYDNTMLSFGELPLEEQTRMNDLILRDERRHCGRSSYYNALRVAGASQLVLNFACGHGAAVMQWNGSLGPRAPQALLEELKTYIQVLIADFKLAPSISLLARKLRNLPKSKMLSSRLVKLNIIGESSAEQTNPLFTAGLSCAEMSLHSRTINQLATESRKLTKSQLLIAIAIEIGLPPENLLRFSYSSDLLLLSGQYVFAKACVWHSDFGGMSLMPIKLCRYSERERFASIRILSKHINAHGPNVKVLWKSSSDTERQYLRDVVGRSFLRLILAPRFARGRLSSEDGWSMLCRFAAHTAIWKYGGAIQASLEGRERSLGLNNVSFLDVIEQTGGSRNLKLLNGCPFELSSPPSRNDRSTRSRSALNCLGAIKVRGRKPKKRFASPHVRTKDWQLKEWETFLLECLPLVTTREIKIFLKAAGVGSRATSELARVLSQRFEASGFSVESERLPWLPAPRTIWNEAQNRRFCESIEPPVESELSLLCILLLTTGCRPKELYRLSFDTLHIFGTDVLLVIRNGKTERASRTLSLRSLCSDGSLCDQVVADLKQHLFANRCSGSGTLWPAISGQYKFRMGRQKQNTSQSNHGVRQRVSIIGPKPHVLDQLDGRRVTPLLRKRLGLSAKDLRPYDFRHLAIMRFHCETLASHQHRNEIYSLITSSREMGHASLITDIGSYSGTAFVAAATGDSGTFNFVSDSFGEASSETLSYEFWRKFLAYHTLGKIGVECLEAFEQAAETLIQCLNSVPRTGTYSIYRASAVAKSLPPAVMLDSPIWTQMQNDQVQLEVNTHLLMEIMKLRKSFAVPVTLKARWKIVQANARKSGLSIRYFGDRRDGKVSASQIAVDQIGHGERAKRAVPEA